MGISFSEYMNLYYIPTSGLVSSSSATMLASVSAEVILSVQPCSSRTFSGKFGLPTTNAAIVALFSGIEGLDRRLSAPKDGTTSSEKRSHRYSSPATVNLTSKTLSTIKKEQININA